MTNTDTEFYRALSTQELIRLADIVNSSSTMNPRELQIKNIINAEFERRIYNWEMTTV